MQIPLDHGVQPIPWHRARLYPAVNKKCWRQLNLQPASDFHAFVHCGRGGVRVDTGGDAGVVQVLRLRKVQRFSA